MKVIRVLIFVSALASILASTTRAASSPSSLSSNEKPLPFDEALHQIIDRSTRIGAQSEYYQSVEAANVPTRLFFLPTIHANAKASANGDPSSVRLRTSQHAEVQADLNVFRFGADYALMKAAQNDEAQQKELLVNTVLQAEDQAIQTLIGAIQAKLELDVLRRQVKIREDSLQIAQKRYERGFLAEQEVRKVLIDASNAQSRLAQGEISSINSDAALMSLLGTDKVEVQWPWKNTLTNEKIGETIQRLEFKLSNRPDWTAAQAKLDATGYRRGRDYLLMLPSFDTSITYGYYRYAFDAGVPNGPAWQGAFLITLPLFDHLVNLSNARSQAHLIREAEFEKVQVERNADAEVTAARLGLARAVKSALERETTLTKSVNLYQDSLRRFQNGRADTNEMLLDQTRVLDTELLAISGWSDAHLAFARFCHSLGKRISDCHL